MLRSWFIFLPIFVLSSSGSGNGLLHLAGGSASDPADSAGDPGDPRRRLVQCPVVDPTLDAQYRAVLLHLRAEGVRRVIVLRRAHSCPHTDLLERALRQTGMKRLGGPLVVKREADWAQLDSWGRESPGDVVLLAQDGELLAEAIGQRQAGRWRDSFWYAPGLEQDGTLPKVGFAHKFKVLTTRIAKGALTEPQQDVAHTPSKTFIRPVSSNVPAQFDGSEYHNTTHTRQSLNGTVTCSPSAVVLRWAPPVGQSGSRLLQVLRASPWLLVGVYCPGQQATEQPAALLLQSSVLSARLAAAGCAAWQAELSGADPIDGAALRRLYRPDTMPSVVALQGAGPLRLAVRCAGRRTMLRCRLDTQREQCRWGRQSSSRRRRAAAPSYRWRPVRPIRRRARPGSRYQHRTGRPGMQAVTDHWHETPRHHRSQETVQHRLNERHQQQVPVEHRLGLANRHWRGAPPSIRRAEEASPEYGGVTYQPYSSATYSFPYGGAANRRQLSPRRRLPFISPDISLAVLPHFSTCGGALGGCFMCILVLETLDSGISPVACVGPCAVGGSTACSGALGTLYKMIVDEQRARARAGRSGR